MSDVLVATFTMIASDEVRNEYNDYETGEAGTDDDWHQHVHLILCTSTS